MSTPTCRRSHVLVTGASSGIGRATALRLAAAGRHGFAAMLAVMRHREENGSGPTWRP